MRLFSSLVLAALLFPCAVRAQGPGVPSSMPLAVEMKKVEVGAWADYSTSMGSISLTTRWALVGRDAKSNTLELTTKGGPIAKPIVVRVVLPADPTSDAKPPKPMVVQLGDESPMLMPADIPTHKFQRPDPKHLVGKEDVKVAAGTFKTSHYKETNASGTVEVWINEDVLPLGIVKAVTTPAMEKDAPPAMQSIQLVMELAGTGKGAKPVITKKPKPFDEKKMGGLVGAP